jgi:anti-anti-sigma regulatory factor
MAQPVMLHGGFYDSTRNAELATELEAISPHSDVIIDLASTEHLDCSSLSLMLQNLMRWKREKPGTELRLINVNPGLCDVMRLLKLDRVFLINQDPRE